MAQKCNTAHTECPFEYLPYQSDSIVQNWYKARAYVLYLLNHTIEVSHQIPQCWHFIVDGDSELMLSVVRHLALYSHFTNYEEYDILGNLSCRNRTVITLVCPKSASDIETEIKKKESLGNLTDYCKLSLFGEVRNADSYIDIAIEVVKDMEDCHPDSIATCITITEDAVEKWIASQVSNNIFSVDTRKALYASQSYNLGEDIKNIPYEDINCAKHYLKAISAFHNTIFTLGSKTTLIQPKWKDNPYAVKCGISNIFCADCFEIREKEIKFIAQQEHKSEQDTWHNHLEALSHCEHNRWVVERLILGFRPLGKKEKFEYRHWFYRQRENYLSLLKKDAVEPKHIDLCSNRELRRVDPDNMRYDSFLMLAIPLILEKVREEQ